MPLNGDTNGAMAAGRGPSLPSPRGPLSEALIEALRSGDLGLVAWPGWDRDDVLAEDAQLTLYVLYELHYRGFRGLDERLEWHPALVFLRTALEEAFEQELRASCPKADVEPSSVAVCITQLLEDDPAPQLSTHMETQADLGQFREFLIHRSAYQLKEADPHSWAIPRLSGPAKAALVEVQADEYGGGRPDRVHAVLFAKAMRALDLDPSYGAHLNRIPAVTLATVNLMSMCGLNRRLRGAIVGHLAAFESGSPIPNSRYAKGLRRLGCSDDALDFFDEHVEADSVHENIALYDMAQRLAIEEPRLADDIVFGASSLLHLDGRFSEHLLGSWEAGRSSLLEPVVSVS